MKTMTRDEADAVMCGWVEEKPAHMPRYSHATSPCGWWYYTATGWKAYKMPTASIDLAIECIHKGLRKAGYSMFYNSFGAPHCLAEVRHWPTEPAGRRNPSVGDGEHYTSMATALCIAALSALYGEQVEIEGEE